jgi:carboxyl-terminal processing protease
MSHSSSQHQRLFRALLIAAATLAGCRTAPQAVAPTTVPAFNRDLNLQSFDEMFARIRDSYYDPARLAAKPAGIDWEALRLRLRPRIEAATSMDDVRATMSVALDTLGESHFAILPGPLYDGLVDRAADEADNASPGSVGIHVRTIHGIVIVGSVESGSAAAGAKVRAGWAIESIDGEDISTGADQLRASFGEKPMTNVRTNEWVESKLILPIGERVNVTFRALDGSPKTVRLKSGRQPGLWASFGMLPAMNLRYSATRLPGEIGYFTLSVFLNPPQVMPVFGQFIKENQDARGLIIDLRGNPGGLGAMATGMCGFLIADEGQKIGTMLRRDGRLQFVVNPRYPQYAGPVAILVDEMSLSTSEILASGLQDLGRAKVFGQQTPGAALPSAIVRLANGDALQYALADYVSASGRRLEGQGVKPDVVVPLDRKSLEAGRDDVLEAARNWIVQQSPATTQGGAS